MKQHELLSGMLSEYLHQATMNLDIATDQGATPYERAMAAMVATRFFGLLMPVATELQVLIRAGKLNQEAQDPLAFDPTEGREA